MITFHPFHSSLLKLAKIDIAQDILNLIVTADPATNQFFIGVAFDGGTLKISLALSIKDSRLNTLNLNPEVVEKLEKKPSYVNHVVEGDRNQVVFSFGFGQDADFIQKLYSKTDHLSGQVELPYNEQAFQSKKKALEVEKQNIINIENILEEKKEYLETVKKEIQTMKEENEKTLEFKKLVEKKLNQ
jgi:hypothetical protein